METVSHAGRTTAFLYRDGGESSTGASSSLSSSSLSSSSSSLQSSSSPPTVLFVHGSGATHGIWKAQLSRLADDLPVAALDLSGHGESDDVETEPGPQTLDEYAADVLAVAETVDADFLVGNSLGGAVVLTALLDHDAGKRLDLDGVVMAGSGAKLTVHENIRDWLSNDWDRAVDFLHDPDNLFHDADDRYVSMSRKAMRDVGQAVTRRDFLSCHTFDVRDRLDELPCPLFAITGEHDSLTPPAYHEYLAKEVPDGEWTTVLDAAHLSMLETPDAFNVELGDWVVEQA